MNPRAEVVLFCDLKIEGNVGGKNLPSLFGVDKCFGQWQRNWVSGEVMAQKPREESSRASCA